MSLDDFSKRMEDGAAEIGFPMQPVPLSKAALAAHRAVTAAAKRYVKAAPADLPPLAKASSAMHFAYEGAAAALNATGTNVSTLDEHCRFILSLAAPFMMTIPQSARDEIAMQFMGQFHSMGIAFRDAADREVSGGNVQ